MRLEVELKISEWLTFFRSPRDLGYCTYFDDLQHKVNPNEVGFRYRFSFWKVPHNRKRPILVSLKFDDDADYIGIEALSKTVSKKEVGKWESEMMTKLLNDGWVYPRGFRDEVSQQKGHS